MEIGEFAEYMFVTNTSDRSIYMNLEGIENNKDLFLCFIDLFCKGLILKFGNGATSINFEDLNLDKFSYLKIKMAQAGICIHLDIQENEIELPTSINGEEIDNEDENKPLESYIFKICNGKTNYHIHFSLEHKW